MLLKLYSALGAVQYAVSPKLEGVGYWEKMALRSMGAKSYRIASADGDAEILGQIQNIYKLEGMDKKPKVILYEQDTPNAAFIHTGTIVISTGLLKLLDKDERETVLAHEITHQQQNGWNLAALGAYIAATYAATTALVNQVKRKVPDKFNGTLFTVSLFGLVGSAVSYITQIPLFAHKRAQEFDADRGAAWITGKPDKLISALQKLERYSAQMQDEQQSEIPHTDKRVPVMGIHSKASKSDGSFTSMVSELYSSHPPTDSRVERLEAIRAEQEAMGVHHLQRS